jgi:hypothetical protein
MRQNRRGANVQQLSLLETTPLSQNNSKVWTALDDEQRALVVAVLARLIVKLTAAGTSVNLAPDVEANHD